MYKVDIQRDLAEAAALERKRNKELQRQSRIFNVKNRTIGVDVETLANQVAERKSQEEREKAVNEAFGAQQLYYDKLALLLEEHQNQKTQDLNKALLEFREQYQKPESRREFDLNDPEGLKKDKPARISDDDPRCGPASLQRFQGEDLSTTARKKFQQQQSRSWLTEQQKEKATTMAQQKYSDNLFDLKRIELDQRAMHLSNLEEECRKAINVAVKNINQALEAELTEKQRVEKQRTQEENFAEMYNHLTSNILTENPATANSVFGSHRVITDRWKGMTPQQLEEIRKAQEEQCQEKKIMKEEEKKLDTEWDKQRLLSAEVGLTIQREQEKISRHLRESLDKYNQQLAREQNTHLQYLEQEVYTNPPTAQYFAQFNTSSR
ncbi:RIB43A-like with coiled-coils protein 2 [Protopterus annectens]|uniref:RIB43A-like with coiled-coils protein 2 n=1 Tax=Protopterus annectens TaxID=7888 RepID=UPI001CFABF24|nr:RIB43A-like with coiled-coils protein 2 [Protopterus annectens]XP_043916477.1 RIB43A-like with coiled-coils protein 2 [Protopterus annectens]